MPGFIAMIYMKIPGSRRRGALDSRLGLRYILNG